MLAFHVQNVPKEDVISFFKGLKAEFALFEGGSVRGVEVRGIPHSCLFDHRGNLVFEDHPGLAEKKLKELVENMPDPLIGEGPYKKLGSLAKKICQRKGLGKIMSQLSEKIEKAKKPGEKEEAEKLLGRLQNYAQKLKTKADGAKDQDPLQYYNLQQQLAKEFKGNEIGTEAQEVVKGLKKDKEFQRTLKAEKEFAKIEAMTETFKPCQNNKPLNIKNCAGCQKKNAASLNTIVSFAKRLIKKYPDTPAAQKTQGLLDELGRGGA